MALLTREAILGADDLPTRDVPVPEWKGTVRVRSMTAGDRDAFEAEMVSAQRGGAIFADNVRARLAAACIVDDKGKQVFTVDDITDLGNKSASALARVYDAISQMNAISAADVEEMAGNSDAAPDGDSSSGSPSL